MPALAVRTLRVALLALAGLVPASATAAAPRVFNGEPTPVPPYMGIVIGSSATGGWLCGGTAIAPNVVLTAAHCVVESNEYVDAASLSVTFGVSDPGLADPSRADAVVRYVAPEDYGVYDDGATTYDIALLQVRDRAPGTLAVIPPERADLLRPGTPATVMGWGLTDDGDDSSSPGSLLSAPLPISPGARCAADGANYDPELMLCAGDGINAAPCSGDSGGPLLVRDPATQTVYETGVVSYGGPCELLGSSDVFANLAGETLGTFVRTYAAQLQALADAGDTGAETFSPTAPVTAERLDAARARAAARAYARKTWGLRVTRSTCSRRSATSVVCRIEGARRGERYAGRLRATLARGKLTVAPLG